MENWTKLWEMGRRKGRKKAKWIKYPKRNGRRGGREGGGEGKLDPVTSKSCSEQQQRLRVGGGLRQGMPRAGIFLKTESSCPMDWVGALLAA